MLSLTEELSQIKLDYHELSEYEDLSEQFRHLSLIYTAIIDSSEIQDPPALQDITTCLWSLMSNLENEDLKNKCEAVVFNRLLDLFVNSHSANSIL